MIFGPQLHFKKQGKKRRVTPSAIAEALKEGVITQHEADTTTESAKIVLDAIQVDEFTEKEFLERSKRFRDETKTEDSEPQSHTASKHKVETKSDDGGDFTPRNV